MKTITLKSNGLGRYEDVSPFIIADCKLELKFNLPILNGQFFFIAENNEAKIKKFIPDDGKITLDCLTAGELKAEVKHYLRGELIECYKIEPLLLCAVDCNLSATPEIAELKAGISALGKSFEEYKQAAELREIRTQKTLKALIKFAFKDYNDNVYLKGGTVDEFLKEFGIELSEEEIKEIFGGDIND